MSVRSTPFMLHSKTVSTGPRSTICGRYSHSRGSLTTREEVAKRASDDDIRERGANERHVCCELAEIQYPTFPKGNQEGTNRGVRQAIESVQSEPVTILKQAQRPMGREVLTFLDTLLAMGFRISKVSGE